MASSPAGTWPAWPASGPRSAAGFITGGGAVVFVDNQDTERDGSMLDYAAGAACTLADVFMAGLG